MRQATLKFTPVGEGEAKVIAVSVPETWQERVNGLVGQLRIDRGMAFFEDGGAGHYTMRGMLVPLDMIVVGTNGHVRFVDKGTPGYVSIYQPPVGMVIELAFGQAKVLGIGPGTKVDVLHITPVSH